MKKTRLFTAVIVVLCAGFSCTNENEDPPVIQSAQYDTLMPGSYFPAYPGSHWQYTDNNGQTSTYQTSANYVLDAYRHDAAGFISDSTYIPLYNGTPVWGYEMHTGPISHGGSYPLTRILSETLPPGSSWLIAYWGGNEISRKIVAVDTTVIINGQNYYPTIVVEEYMSQGPPVYTWKARRYYTKHIGIVREEINGSPLVVKELSAYFVNFPP